MSSARRRPSITDVARLAGVSGQTVSRVANGSQAVSPETRRRVVEAMSTLGYAPNRAAQSLRHGRSHTIGIVAHRLDRTGEALTVEAVVRAAEAEGYSVTLTTVADPRANDWAGTTSRVAQQDLDGLVIIRNEADAPETLALPPTIPIAVSDSRLVGRHPGVAFDQAGGTRAAVEHLVGLGHRRIAHVAGPDDSEPARVRHDTWRAVLTGAGLVPGPVLVGDWSAGSGYWLGLELAGDPSVTAVFCANDDTALGVLRALSECGRRVPEDMSVVGFDGIELSAYGPIPLTTVRQDFALVGQELVRLLLAQLAGTPAAELGRTTIPTEMVVRASTAPPRG